jgi:hypothetical protein
MPVDLPGAIMIRTPKKGGTVSLWAWVLLAVGGIGLLGAIAISAAVYEFTWMNFRKMDRLD